jgi:chromate transport protein ChrA
VKTLIAIAPVSAMRVETLLGVRSHRMIDMLFVLALLILPINAFVVTLFLLSSVYPDPTTAMPSAVDAAMLILPP